MPIPSVVPDDAATDRGLRVRHHRDRALHAVMAAVAAGSGLSAIVALTRSDVAVALLDVPVAGLPLGVLLLLAVPVTVALCSRPLEITSLGGAVVIAPDLAVLGLALWASAGAVARAPGSGPAWGADPTSLLALCTWVWLVWLAGVAWAETTARRRRGWVRAFNVGLSAVAGSAFLAAAVAVRSVVAGALGQPALTSAIGPWDALAVVAGAGAYVGVDLLLSAAALALADEGRLRDAVDGASTLLAVAAVVTLSSLAVLVAALLVTLPWALALLAPVAVAVFHATGVGVRARAESARSAVLYEATEACQRAEDAEDVREALVRGAERVSGTVAVLGGEPAGEDQLGAPVLDRGAQSWLVCGPRTSGQPFTPDDERVVTTLARLGTESLARLAGVAAIRDLAWRDPLTGSANRATLERALGDELSSAAGPTALLFGDVDGFKAVNDELGHLSGDQLLVTVARRLAAGVRPQDLVARLGGDEFAVLLPATTAGRAAELAARLSASVGAPISIGGRVVDVSISLGSAATDALPPPSGAGSSELRDRLVDAADQAMYGIKRSARAARRGEASAPHHELSGWDAADRASSR